MEDITKPRNKASYKIGNLTVIQIVTLLVNAAIMTSFYAQPFADT
jgi:hypothetical protein